MNDAAPETAPEAPPAAAERGGWRELLRSRRFLLFEASGTLAGAGYAVYSVSVLFLAYSISGNLLLAGLVLFIEYGVYTLTFLVAPFVDRALDKRSVLLVCLPIQALTAALLALQLARGALTTPELIGGVLVLAVLWDFDWAVYMIGPRLIVEKRLLFAADGVSSAIGVGTQVGGYAGGGALVYLVGPDGGAAAYALLLVAAALATVPLAMRVEAPPAEPFWASFRNGWAAFRGKVGRPLRQFLAVEVVYGFFVALPPLLVTAIAYEWFPDPAGAYGFLITFYVIGGAVGGIVVGHFNPRRSVGLLLIVAPVAAGLATLLLLAVPVDLVVLGAIFAFVDAMVNLRYIAKYSWVRAEFAPGELGRVISNVYLFTGVSSSIAALAIGVLSTTLGLAAVIAIAGGGLLVAAAVAATVPFVRSMRF